MRGGARLSPQRRTSAALHALVLGNLARQMGGGKEGDAIRVVLFAPSICAAALRGPCLFASAVSGLHVLFFMFRVSCLLALV